MRQLAFFGFVLSVTSAVLLELWVLAHNLEMPLAPFSFFACLANVIFAIVCGVIVTED